MSIEALNWAFKSKLEKSTHKFVLVALANCADPNGICFPSLAYIAEATAQNIKTVKSAMSALKKDGWLFDTGKRMGSTNQVIVYRLDLAKVFVPVDNSMPVDNSNRPKLGPVSEDTDFNNFLKEAQNRNRPVLGRKEALIRATEPSLTISLSKSDTAQKIGTPAEMVATALIKLGINCAPCNPKLLALLDQGLTPEEIVDAGYEAQARHVQTINYVLSVAEGRRRDADNIPPLPNRKSPAPTHPSHVVSPPSVPKLRSKPPETLFSDLKNTLSIR